MTTCVKLCHRLFLAAAVCACISAVRAQPTFTVLHTFAAGGPHFPECTLVETSPGIFYGTTSAGPGSSTTGTLFAINSSGAIRFLHVFDGTTEGNAPNGALLQAQGGNLYGVTLYGGAGQNGTIFRSDLAGHLRVLYAFSGQPNTITAYSLIEVEGVIYGTLSSLDSTVPGQIFKLNQSAQVITVHAFTDAEGQPAGPVIQASNGSLYGLSNNGSIYRLARTGAFNTIYTFSGDDGNTPIGNLSQAANARLYGVNAFGGANNWGTAFSVTLDGSFRVEHAFTGGTDGGFPLTGTARADDGNIYGTTGLGPGTVFQIDTAGEFTMEATFGPGGNANFASPAVVQGSNGLLYGVQTTFGGTVYSLDLGLKPPAPKISGFNPASGPVGTAVTILGSGFLGATSVTFNGTAAAFTVTSSNSIHAVVPVGATSGPISVTTPNGLNNTANVFTVTP